MKHLTYRQKLAIGFCTIALALSCKQTNGLTLLSPPAMPDSSDKVSRTIGEWVKTGRDTHDFQTVIKASALYLSWSVRTAILREMIVRQSINAAEQEERLRKEAFNCTKWNQFLVAVDSSNLKWTELANKDEIWKIYLVNQKGDRLEPAKIEEWQPTEAEVRTYYQFVTPWSKLFRIDFSSSDSEGNAFIHERDVVSLEFKSLIGQTTLKWQLGQ